MSLTPAQIKERLGSRYPWPLYNKVVPTVFDDCVTWEEQVLWLYRFILGVYLELQDEGYITIDEVLEDSPAAVKSSGIWKFVMDHVNALNTALDALDGKLTGQMEQLNTDLRKLVADTVEQLTQDMQALQDKINGDLQVLEQNLSQQIQALDTRLTKAIADAVSDLTAKMDAMETELNNAIQAGDAKTAQDASEALATESARLEALIRQMQDGLDGVNTHITEIQSELSEIQSQLETLANKLNAITASGGELRRGTGLNIDHLLSFSYSALAGSTLRPYYPAAGGMPNILASTVTITKGNGCVILSDPGFELYSPEGGVIAPRYGGVLSFLYGESSRNAAFVTVQVFMFTPKSTGAGIQLVLPDSVFSDITTDKYLAVWHPYYSPPNNNPA